MRPILRLVGALLAVTAPAVAEDWIALGGMGFEMDTTSIEVRGDTSSAWIRTVNTTPQGKLATHMLIVAHCDQDFLEIERGVLESDWSAKVVEMPQLPPEDRFMELPVENPAFNNLYAYLCN